MGKRHSVSQIVHASEGLIVASTIYVRFMQNLMSTRRHTGPREAEGDGIFFSKDNQGFEGVSVILYCPCGSRQGCRSHTEQA